MFTLYLSSLSLRRKVYTPVYFTEKLKREQEENMKNKKVILITGASAGIGHATAKDLILKGHIVYCAARSTDKMEDLKNLGGHIIKLDITKEEEIQSCVDQVMNEQKRTQLPNLQNKLNAT